MEIFITNKKGNRFRVFFDDADAELINNYKWYVRENYVVSTTIPAIRMHRLILGITDPKIHGDHKNHNPLDNRRENLRAVTHKQNMLNRKPRGKSKYLGVYTVVNFGRNNNGVRYEYIMAQIKLNGKNKRIGTFKTEIEAAHAYDAAAKIYHGEFANLNFK